MSELKPTCCGRISIGIFSGSKICGKTAKFDRNGKHYCKTHDPVTIAEKEAIKTAAWKAEWAAKDAARDAAKAKQAELERRADCYTELLEALRCARNELHACQAVIHLHGGFDPAYVGGAQKALKIMDTVIAKALGETA